jgi:hypothetical protein
LLFGVRAAKYSLAELLSFTPAIRKSTSVRQLPPSSSPTPSLQQEGVCQFPVPALIWFLTKYTTLFVRET